MNILIYSLNPDGTGALLLQREASAAGHSAKIVTTYEDAMAAFEKESVDIFIPRFSHESYEIAANICEMAMAKGIFVTVTPEGIRTSFDKALTYQSFVANGIPTPPSMKVSQLPVILDEALRLPVILKPLDENRGRGICVAETDDELQEKSAELLETYGFCIAQNFISESSGCDIRVFVIGDAVVACMERVGAPGSVLSNIAQGGHASPVEISNHENTIAIQASKVCGAEFSGVDIIRSDKGSLVLEVNTSPGFKIADICKVPVARLVIDHLINRRKNG